MSFDSSIPTIGQPRDQAQIQLLANFSAIFNAMAVNHIPLDQDLNKAGQHNQLLLTTVGDPTTLSDEIGLYQKVGTSSAPQLFFRPASNGTPIQLSYQTTQQANATNGSTQNQSYMAGPFIMLFGSINNVTSGQTFTYSTYYPKVTFSSIPQVWLIPFIPNYTPAFLSGTNIAAAPNSITTTSFTISTTTVGTTKYNVYYLIIGQP